jgi:TonB-linked SusC/RagA family outer membrane protein
MKNIIIPLFLLFNSIGILAQNALIKGTILNPTGTPLVGATIAVNEGIQGTVSNEQGYFALGLTSQPDSLSFSMTGYQTYTLLPPFENVLQIVLTPNVFQLGEVVVVGFGTQDKRQLTSSVSSIGKESFENIPVTNWQQALQGRLPGVAVTMASGGLDASSSIRIRGVGSLSAGNQPLIVIDGVVLSGLGGIESLGFMTNPFISINPEDIASVEVLKDAAATAMYGSRGSNGVILITTKEGRYYQSPKLRLGYYAGVSEIAKRYDLMDGKEYASYYNHAAQNVGQSDNLYEVDQQPDADWQSLLLRRGFVQQANASLSGGNAKTRYFVSGTFRDEEGYLITTELQRYNLRANIEHQINDRWKAGVSLAPTRIVDHRTGHQFTGSPFGWAAWYYPNVDPFDERGEPVREPLITSNGFGGFTGNPLVALIDQEAEVTTQQLIGRGYLAYSPLKNLQLRTEMATETSQEAEWKYEGPATFFGRNGGAGSIQNQDIRSWQWTNQLDWSPTLAGGHQFAFTAGSQYLQTNFSGSYIAGSGFPNDQIQFLNSTAQVSEFFSWQTSYAFLGYFLRGQYSFRDKYLLGVSARYDGSSRFGGDRRFGFFPALSAAYVAIDQQSSKAKGIQYLKIRSSIGLTGNAEIENFVSRGLVGFNADYLGVPGFLIQSLENLDLGWEKSLQWDVGLDFSMFDQRISGSFDFYLRDTRDLLLEKPIPATNGVSGILENVGAVRNLGVEWLIDWDVLRGPLQWSMQLNGATLSNQILRLVDQDGDGLDDDIIQNGRNLFRPGETVGAFYLVRYAGVDPSNGDALFYDLEGNTPANQAPAENRQLVGSPLPTLTGGITQNLRFRQWDLSAFFHFKAGHQIYLMHGSSLESNMGSGFNQLRTQLDSWTPENTNTNVPQARLGQTNGSQPSTRYLHDADFLRLQNLTLGYTLPKRGKQEIEFRFFASVQNLFTITSFPGLDPDSEFFPVQNAAQGGVLYNLPASRIFTFGMNAGL